VFDAKMLAASTARVMRKALAPVLARLDAIEAMQPKRGAPGAPGEPGRDGKDADMDLLLERAVELIGSIMPAAIDAAVPTIAKAAAALIPPPEKGDKGDPGDSIQGDPGEQGRDGKDGVGVTDALIDRDGHLVLTFADGSTKKLGLVMGKNGDPGKDGRDGTDVGLEDIGMELMEDGRTLCVFLAKGEARHEFRIPFPVVLDRGVWEAERSYEEGDGVTWGGSWWIAQRATSAKPDGTESGWRLAVKKGRDGKDATT
jgi:hypothetical protein